MKLRIFQVATVVLFAGVAFPQSNPPDKMSLEECIRRELLNALSSPRSGAPAATPVPLSISGRHFDVLDLTKNLDPAQSGSVPISPFLALVNENTFSDSHAMTWLDKTHAIFVLKESGVEAAQAALARTIGQPEIMAAIPVDQKGVKRVFGIPESEGDITADYLLRASVDFKRLPNSRILLMSDTKESVADELLAAAGRHSANLLVVVAHNEEGILRLPDGSSVSVATLQRRFTDSGRPGLILACETVSSGSGTVTLRRLGFREIASALRATTALKASNRYGDYLYVLQDQLSTLDTGQSDRIKHAVVVAVAGTAGSALLIAFASSPEPCRDKSGTACESRKTGVHQ